MLAASEEAFLGVGGIVAPDPLTRHSPPIVRFGCLKHQLLSDLSSPFKSNPAQKLLPFPVKTITLVFGSDDSNLKTSPISLKNFTISKKKLTSIR